MQLTIFFNYCCLEISITVTVFTFIFQLDISVLNTDISPKSVLYLNVTGPPLSKVGFLPI